jgi:5,10-methylenetetrahydromethanopterin reductase
VIYGKQMTSPQVGRERHKNMPRLGISFVGNYATHDVIRYASEAEKNNYESVWIAEDLGMRDAVVPIASAAASTSKIKLASGIIPIYYRPPSLMAMTAATLDELSHGRFVLGLGNGLKNWVEQQGLEFRKPLRAMREYVENVRRILEEQNGVTAKGEVYSFNSVKLHFRKQHTRVPIYIAARGPKMFQLGGEIGDGVLNSEEFRSPEYFKWIRENLKEGAERAGRNPSEVDLASYVFVSVSDDFEKAKEMVKPRVASMLAEGVLDPHVERMNLSEDEMSAVKKAVASGDPKAISRTMTDSILDASAIYGTAKDCERGMKDFRASGVDLPILFPVGSDISGLIKLAKDW